MRSDEFDKKIIEAAEHHQPDYSEKSWPEMKKLLDVHLPEKKDDKRKYIFLLFLLLCLGGGLWLVAVKPWKEQTVAGVTPGKTQESVSSGQPTDPETGSGEKTVSTRTVPAAQTKEPQPTASDPARDGMNQPQTGKATPLPAGNEQTTTNTFTTEKNKSGNADPAILNKSGNMEGKLTFTSGGGPGKTKAKQKNALPETGLTVTGNKQTDKQTEPIPVAAINPGKADETKPETMVVPPVSIESEKTTQVENKPAETQVTATTEAKEPEKEPVVAAKPATRSPLKKSINFAFTLSAGPDISAVGVNKLGKVQPVFGAGINISYGKHISLSTGYYAVRKVYKAEAADYKFPTRPYHYSYLYEIDGNCTVVEIPVTLNWAFNARKKGNWFVSAGASSFLMRRETYDYMYKYPSGQVTKYTKQFGNKNQHIFSVVSLSGGYRYNLSKSVFISAEPYLKIPLKGVGAGKLDLNSGGMLFTIGIKPF